MRTDNGFGIYVNNNGLGPAIVINTKIFIDGNKIEIIKNKPWQNAVKALNIDYKYVQMGFYEKDTIIAAGERRPLLTVDINISDKQEENFKNIIPRIGMEIHYKSIYDIKDVVKLESTK